MQLMNVIQMLFLFLSSIPRDATKIGIRAITPNLKDDGITGYDNRPKYHGENNSSCFDGNNFRKYAVLRYLQSQKVSEIEKMMMIEEEKDLFIMGMQGVTGVQGITGPNITVGNLLDDWVGIIE